MIAIDLFAGVGGMSTGAAQAGIDVKFAVERDKYAASAYRKNHPHCEIFVDDIRCLSSRKIKQIPRGSDGTVVFGGPPCQGFSYSNTRTREVRTTKATGCSRNSFVWLKSGNRILSCSKMFRGSPIRAGGFFLERYS